ncbi:Uncharacterised protein [Mycobacteroides abscessus subsp. abscessus]|nr:Uncharacterised protein [Mycobacteroides abscessus subsp. abscessus]
MTSRWWRVSAAACCSGEPSGFTCVEPSHTHTPVCAAAASITALAWSATGCSRDCCSAAIPQAAL